MGDFVTLRVVGVVVQVVGFRVNLLKGACYIEGVVDSKCDVVLLEEVSGYSGRELLVSIACC
jgi:hypothetical protein